MFVVLALAPLLVVLYLMIGRQWGGSQAGPMGWATAVGVALLFFGANPLLLAVALGRGLLLALYVLYIIWMALLLYHVINEAGAIRAIGQTLPQLAPERGVQALLLAWVFGGFLQGASGFGVPAAVVAPLLVGLGFAPVVAVTAALMGHAWAVSFGSLGSSFFALMAATGVEGTRLAVPSAIYLGLACFCCGTAVLWAMDGWAAVRRQAHYLLSIGLIMAGTQCLLAHLQLWSLASFGAGLMGLLAMMALLSRHGRDFDWRSLGRAFQPYILLTIVIVLGQLVFKEMLATVQLNYSFPAVQTSLGYQTPAGAGRSISLFGHPGALLLYASGLVFLWYKWRDTLNTAVDGQSEYSGWVILQKAVAGSRKSTISIVTLVIMATTMEHAGMTQALAAALSNTGSAFPLLSPFLGSLGAFMTGSNTNSNVVFGALQLQTAQTLNLSVPFVLAAQNAGGALGSVFAPAKVVVGCSTVSGAGDAAVLKLALRYGLTIVAFLGLTTLFFA